MRLIAVAALGMLASTNSLRAQNTGAPRSNWELRFTSGGLVATGQQRNSLKDAQMSMAQMAWRVRQALAVTGTFGWARSRDVSAINSPKLDVFTYDVGVEARPAQWFGGHAMTFNPYIGAGAGARSYNYRSLDVAATHNLAGYATAGGELGYRRVGVRLEARDYMSGFKPLAGGGSSDARNDVVIMVGLRIKH
jgi:hypothetical protein